jgi:iron complex outermembrane receptor protein
VTLRGSRSRNFRAPTLNQLVSPSTTTAGVITVDPCDADRINSGPNPAVRRSNCQALFAAHPSYGPLATFQDGAENFASVMITSGGNPNLRNEVSDTTTFGVVLQPTFVPGLTIVADKIKVDLTDGLSLFTTQNFLATCFDSTSPSDEICGKFTRDAAGQVTSGVQEYFNAGSVRFRGETYNVNYSFPVGRFFEGRELGTVELGVEATHVTLLETSVTGFDRSRTDDTIIQPEWTTRFDARYTKGPLRLSYSMFYLPEEPITSFDTIETSPNPVLKANIRHSVSGQYDFGRYTVRAGVSNLTDEEPSYPSRSYGDILGRQYYLGLRARF